MAGQETVAIVGMACLFPGAPDLAAFWQNIVGKVDAVGDPPDGWGAAEVFDPNSAAGDRIYTKRGGFLRDLATFDPLEFGVMPNAVDGAEPEHFLALRVARDALADAGYDRRPFPRDRTAVILGRGTFLNRGSVTALQHGLALDQTVQVLQRLHPEYGEPELARIRAELKAGLPPFNPETAPGLVSNVMCGRIANRLDLNGPNYAVDAACASSLIALDLGMRELLDGRCDLALAGGVSVSTPPIVFMVFCQLGALSRRGQVRPFDRRADGTLLGEGLGIVVLKRRSDAVRDGDRIYGLVRAVGTASDGHGLAVLAPRVEGEELALRRAYDAAGVSPATVELIEAHGTGTAVGDRTEVEALRRVFGGRDGPVPGCAIGSVKSMISHVIPAAGIAGVIKAALALHHRVLPPTINCEEPDPALGLEASPFYVNTEPRPWVHGRPGPRRAGVNAFGFGGINAHAVLEELPGEATGPPSLLERWPSEVFIVQGASRQELGAAARGLLERLAGGLRPQLRDLAYTLNCPLRDGGERLAIVARSLDDLKDKLARALERLADPARARIQHRGGIFYAGDPLAGTGRLAVLFPGEGSQFPGMLSELCLHFPEVRRFFDEADRIFLENCRDVAPSAVLFRSEVAGTPAEVTDRIWRMDYAVAAVLAAGRGLFGLLEQLGVRPDAVAGHSSGELGALLAAGALEDGGQGRLLDGALALNRIVEQLERRIPEAALVAVGGAPAGLVAAVLEEAGGAVQLAMDNCPGQVVLCGPPPAVARARDRLARGGAICMPLPFDRPYHSPLFRPVCAELAGVFAGLPFTAPRTTVYSCVTARPYPSDPEGIRRLANAQWAMPVRFRELVETMYRDGVRIFVEAGPRGSLSSFVGDTLGRRPHLAVAADTTHRSGIDQLNHLLALLAAHGTPLRLDRLYTRRGGRRLDQDTAAAAANAVPGKAARLTLALPRLRLPGPDGRAAPARPATATTGAGNGRRTRVLDRYLATMERFLATEQELLQATTLAPRPRPGPGFALAVSRLDPGQALAATCQLDLERHPFLADHTLGRDPSALDTTATALPVVPLSVSLELMAQAAALLAGGRLVSVRDLKAHRWIVVAERAGTVALEARATGGGDRREVRVRVRTTPGGKPARAPGELLAEGTFGFAPAYPAPPSAPLPPLEAPRPYRLGPDGYYTEVMFHGPAFQSVAVILRSADGGLDAVVQVPDGAAAGASLRQLARHTDPVLVDAAGQLTGFWAADRLDRGFVVFPVGFGALTVHRPWPSSGPVTARARVRLEAGDRIRSTVQFEDEHGRVLVDVADWEDQRFDFPREFVRFVLAPGERALSRPWPAPAARLPLEAARCQRLDALPDALFDPSGIWAEAWPRLVLGPSERRLWTDLAGPGRRRREWMQGRLAAKDAVRLLLEERHGRRGAPADVELIPGELGQPTVTGRLAATDPGRRLRVSITHSNGVAVALAAECSGSQGVGIDVEVLGTVRPELLERGALSEEERAIAGEVAPEQRPEWLLRLWCAKEAVAKALGRGIAGSPRDLAVRWIDPDGGAVGVALEGELRRQLPGHASTVFTASTGREGELVVAVCVAELEKGADGHGIGVG